MKKHILLLAAICLSLSIFCQSPQLLSYQSVIRNTTTGPIKNTEIGMQVSILQGDPEGIPVYIETHSPKTNSNGLVSVEIGNGSIVSGTISAIEWSNGPYFIKTETDPSGGSDYSLVSTTQILSVPYALFASQTDWASQAGWAGQSGIAGKLNYVTKCTNFGQTFGLSQIVDDGINVGIGDTLPTYKLSVLNAGSTGILSKSTSSFSVVDIDGQSGDAALRLINNGVQQWNLRNRPSDNSFEIVELSGGGSRFVIQDATGNVGIGETTNPTYKLDVLTAGSTGIRSRSSSSFSVIDIDAASGDAALRFQKAGVNQWNVRNDPSTDNFQIFELGGGGERFRIENSTGKVVVSGAFTAVGVKAFTIDHPLDPANKILMHAATESNEVINIYSGNVITDNTGKALVQLPDYYEALNIDSRYQLTVIGVFAQAIISKEVNNNQFEISTNIPNVKVSWEVKGVRNDTYMQNNPFQAEINKTEAEKSVYESKNQPFKAAKVQNIPAVPSSIDDIQVIQSDDKKAEMLKTENQNSSVSQ